MITSSGEELGLLLSQFFHGPGGLVLAVLGSTLVGLILQRRHRARIERRLQAAATAYASRELARERQLSPSAYAV